MISRLTEGFTHHKIHLADILNSAPARVEEVEDTLSDLGIIGICPAPEEINLEEVMQIIQAGTEGKIVDVEDEEDNERVEIFVE